MPFITQKDVAFSSAFPAILPDTPSATITPNASFHGANIAQAIRTYTTHSPIYNVG